MCAKTGAALLDHRKQLLKMKNMAIETTRALSEAKLIFTALAELTTKQIAQNTADIRAYSVANQSICDAFSQKAA